MHATAKKTPPTRRAPKQQRSIHRIDAILTATEAVLAEDGYDGLTVVRIAALAGITHTWIYHYYAEKDKALIWDRFQKGDSHDSRQGAQGSVARS